MGDQRGRRARPWPLALGRRLTIVKGREAEAVPPLGPEERFAGSGIMGLPFASGHVLARIGGVDLGAPRRLGPPARLGAFVIPRHGPFVIGPTFFATGHEVEGAAGQPNAAPATPGAQDAGLSRQPG